MTGNAGVIAQVVYREVELLEPSTALEPGRGVYDTDRASAHAGVPARTLRYWAARGIYRPSISPHPRTRLWSWADLLALRAIDAYRRDKGPDALPRVSMAKIHQMLWVIEEGESPEALYELVAPYFAGPDLLRPRPLLRIIPGKLHGEPHVQDTRVSTAVLYRLSEMGYDEGAILEMYPSVTGEALAEALDLEWSVQPAA